MTAVSPQTLLNFPWMGLVDIRDDEERWLLGYPPGSVRVSDAKLITSGDLFEALDTTCLVLVCSSGRRAETLAAEIAPPADCSLSYLEGGIAAWKEAGHPAVGADRDMPPPLAGSPDDPTAALSVMRSCFVAALVEGAMMKHDDLDPMEHFCRALASARVNQAAPEASSLLHFADHLAASHRRLGGGLDQITDNLMAVRQMFSSPEIPVGAVG